ncbi:MAG: vWA domain-containing protein [Methanoregula sp.]|nr:vWA domain-containing protein [Methanoregula sp.]
MGYIGISQRNPTCYIFLIDQSGSMSEVIANEPGRIKADVIKDLINRFLMNLVLKCTKEDGVRDFFYVSVIGYGINVGSAFIGPLANKDLVPLSEISYLPARIEERLKEDGAGGVTKSKFPVWFDAVADGQTPMCQALNKAKGLLEGWLSQHPNCHPPIVINITDGAATDGNPLIPAEELKNLKSREGNVLLYNIHLSSRSATTIIFPNSDAKLPTQCAHLLYSMSSPLPDYQINYANKAHEMNLDKNCRGFVYNADPISVFLALDLE